MSFPANDLPDYLRQYVATQDYDQYTAIDHASWRYIMRVSKQFFKDNAHPTYLKGLVETGITTEMIPKISEMDDKLKKFGWRAVVVTGFIPSEIFMEMLSLGILPIASDMRKLEHIDYTPSPDIVHEAAGHAPIIADKAYASYLKKFGEIARKVIFAKEDRDVYLAVLKLSDIKEDPYASPQEIEQAEEELKVALSKVTYASEAQQLSRLGWWSIEYGLFKVDKKYLIYGAGLLSSVGESFNSINKNVTKIPLTLECTHMNFDITKPQPQLYYTDDFKKLESVIEELSETMAYKRGGKYGLDVAIKAGTVTTTQLDSGLQIGGVLHSYKTDKSGNIIFIKFAGPTQIAFSEKQISGQGPKYHKDGFSTPIGKFSGELNLNSKCELQFESGIKLVGTLIESTTLKSSRKLIHTFRDCKITYNNEVLFQPEWGNFDLVIGTEVESVFGGAPDRGEFIRETEGINFKPRGQKINKTKENSDLIPLYARIRSIRESTKWSESYEKEIEGIYSILQSKFSNDWLLRLEILELLSKHGLKQAEVAQKIQNDLKKLREKSDTRNMLITRGLEII